MTERYPDGIHLGLTNAQYQAIPALSYSGLKEFSKTPAHYQAYLRREREETASQRLGTLVHMLTLEPRRALLEIEKIEGNRNANDVKARIKAAQAEGKYVCKTDEFDQACRMRDGLLARESVREILEHPGGVPEISIVWTDPETGIQMKCRPDWSIPDEGIILDLKYFSDLDDRAIEKQMHRMKYYWQAAHYLTGLMHVRGKPSTKFFHAFVMDDDPYLAKEVVLTDPNLEKAEFEMRPHYELYAKCVKENQWPGYPQGIVPIALPDWAWG